MASLTQVHCCSAELINHAPTTELTFEMQRDHLLKRPGIKLKLEGNLQLFHLEREKTRSAGIQPAGGLSINQLTSRYDSTILNRL
jgi:hypothetical protein